MVEIARHNQHEAAALAVALRAHGGRVVLSPGGRSGTLALALLHPQANIEAHMVLDERAAGFLALGWARSSHGPVTLLCTSGSAGAHYLPALIEAWHSRVPLVVITADRPPELSGRGAPQTTSQRFFGEFVAARIDPGPPSAHADWASAFRRAFAISAQSSRPVHLNLPLREPLWSPEPVAMPSEPDAPRSPAAPIAGTLPAELLSLERGVIHCGTATGDGPELGETIAALGAQLGWPVIAEAASGARRHGAHDAEDLVAAAGIMGPPEVVLRFGRCPLHRATRSWLATAAHTVLVDPHGDLHHPDDGPYTLLSADVAATVRGALGPAKPASPWLRRWRTGLRVASERARTACDAGWWEGRIARMTAQAAEAAGVRVHVANSMPIRDLDLFGASTGPVSANRGVNGIDGVVATATGEALGGDVPVWLLTGDLSLLHDASSLSLAWQLGVADRLRIVVVDNGGGGIFHQLPFAQADSALFERAFITPQHLDCGALAAARGLTVARAFDPESLRDALASEAQFIHVRVDRATSVAQRAAARSTAIAAVRQPLEGAPQ